MMCLHSDTAVYSRCYTAFFELKNFFLQNLDAYVAHAGFRFRHSLGPGQSPFPSSLHFSTSHFSVTLRFQPDVTGGD